MNQLALAVLTTLSLAKVEAATGNVNVDVVVSGNDGSGKRNVTGTIDGKFDISKSNFNQEGRDSVSGKKFDLKINTSKSNKQLEIRSRNGAHGGRFILNVQGIPFIRAGTWNKNGLDFDGESFRVALLRLSEVLPANETARNANNFIRLVGQKWSEIRVESSVVAGVSITQFSSSVIVGKCNITLKGMISDQVAQSTEGNTTTTMTPLRFKYGIEVDNFPFTHGGNLHLLKSIRSRQADFQNTNNTVTTNAGTFEWTGDVVVDGKNVAVSSSRITGDASVIISTSDNSGKEDSHQDSDNGVENLFAFNLGQGATIYWDPSLNLEAQSAQQSSSNSLAMGITAVVGALLLF